MVKFLSILSLVVLMSTSAFANPSKEVAQSGQCPTVHFQLPANPSTGYSWKVVDYNETRFKQQKPIYHAPNNKRMGAGGTMSFIFTKRDKEDAVKNAVFLLAYGQAWNKKSYKNTVVVVEFNDTLCK